MTYVLDGDILVYISWYTEADLAIEIAIAEGSRLLQSGKILARAARIQIYVKVPDS
jgi:hypothetical protein